MNAKQRAAEAALQYISDGMIVGLGTGSTADFFLQALGQALATGKLRNIRGLPTSSQSATLATQLGIPLTDFSRDPLSDVTVDGADEVDPQLNLIKGQGGALLREKIVAQNSRRFIIIADDSKLVTHLGTRHPLPVEVAIFGHQALGQYLQTLSAEVKLRPRSDGSPFMTENGNYIYDCRWPRIDDPHALQAKIRSRAGVIETGLFLDIAQTVMVGTEAGVEIRHRS